MEEQEEKEGVRTPVGTGTDVREGFRLHQGQWEAMEITRNMGVCSSDRGDTGEPWHRVESGPEGEKQEAQKWQES